MRIEIIDEKQVLGLDFGNWLVTKVQQAMLLKIDPKKLKKWDKYFNDSEQYKSISGSNIKAEQIVLAGIHALHCIGIDGRLLIRIRPNQFVPNLDRVVVDTTCKLINYGNISIQGYPIFSDAFTNISENIDEYIDMYVGGLI